MHYQELDIQAGTLPSHGRLVLYLHGESPEMPVMKRPIVLICPGGGYGMTSDREADPIALKFLGAGFHAAVLRYSVAPVRFPAALLELAAAVSLLRRNATGWNIDPEKIAVAGFSAGGHLAASLGVFWNQHFLQVQSGLSPEEMRPNGLLLGYPVITSGPLGHDWSMENLLGDASHDSRLRNLVSLEDQVTDSVPQTFLWHTASDDVVPVENSLLFFQALRKAGVPVGLHIYPEGPHGLALASPETAGLHGGFVCRECESWLSLAINWIRFSL